jgi:hypothetical protein
MGVQTGDGNFPGCVSETEAIGDLDSTPEAFRSSPRELLEPLRAGIDGVLVRPSGGTVRLRFSVVLDEGSAEVSYPDDTAPTRAECEESVTLDGALTAEGGDVFGGTGPVRVSASRGVVSLQFESQSFTTTLHPADNPCATAGLSMSLTLGEGCVWRGEWNTTVPLASDTGFDCSMDFAEPLGTFSAPGDCS